MSLSSFAVPRKELDYKVTVFSRLANAKKEQNINFILDVLKDELNANCEAIK